MLNLLFVATVYSCRVSTVNDVAAFDPSVDGRPLLNLGDYEQRARELLHPGAWNTLLGDYGAPDWTTLTNNIAGFDAFDLRPRVLVDVSRRDLATSILGHNVSLPVLISPSGQHQRWTAEGELATARAADSAGTIMALSTASSYSIEEVAAATTGTLFFQLYWMRDRRVTELFVRRAEAAGYRAIMVTVDIPGPRSSERDVRYSWDLGAEADNSPNLEHTRMLRNFREIDLPGFEQITRANFHTSIDDSLTWRDLEWLRTITPLPIVIKGIQSAEDARLCAEHGVDGLVVSNHGAFALEGARATVAALPEVVEGAGGTVEVYLDGGVRRGTDVLKCLALGAKGVFIGRAAIWGLIVAGDAGARHVVEILRSELDRAMAFCGVADVKEVSQSLIADRSR
jgi:isopentenyl diphosphate isomerase/L-lactate dehydrogenase-like FMN-dependent dehydrogenase